MGIINMASGFQDPITIKDAIDNIHNRKYLLPAIQRKFTWSSEQIEMLFDSIMRGYPINSFMLWKITDDEIKSNYKFYEFITRFREFFAENNKDIDTKGVPDFEAIIDGQQRLTSLYIGLRGSYAYKLPRKRLNDTEESIPTRELYLDLTSPINEEHDNQKKFNFKFLSKLEIELSLEHKWFKVGKILDLNSEDKLKNYINNHNLINYASETLRKLHSVIHSERLLNYYLQEEQEPDKVLEIFIRINSGGTPLSFSDLLMSIASANWKDIDVRKEIEKLVSEVNNIRHSKFIISKDFVLKTCLVLFVDDIRFKVKNFKYENINIFESNWNRIRECIVSAFKLFDSLGFNDKTFRAKNAAIPIVYYIYHNNLEKDIISPIYKDKENKEKIKKWLTLTFIKSIFGGQTDSVLKKMKSVLSENPSKRFPDQQLMNAFKNDPARNYSFDDEFIDNLINSEKDSNNASYVLNLLYSNLDLSQELHQDHLHPATIFTDRDKFNKYIPDDIKDFAVKSENWNSIANLQLLNGRQNESKNAGSLKDWILKENKEKKELFLSNETSLDIKDFKEFILDRRSNIKKYIIEILNK